MPPTKRVAGSPLSDNEREAKLPRLELSESDELHSHLDAQLLKKFSWYPEGTPLQPGLRVYILCNLVQHALFLNQAYDSLEATEELFNAHPELHAMVERCWAKKSFKDIRELG